jgi:hypothetical protein
MGASVVLALAWRQEKAPANVLRPVGDYTARDLRTSIYENGALRLRVSAESLRFVQPRALGPFRIGFLTLLEAAGVSFETFSSREGEAKKEGSIDGVADAISSLIRETRIANRSPGRTVGVDLADVRIVQQDSGRSRILFQSARCRSSLGADEIVCEKGLLDTGTQSRLFSKAQYDGHHWKLTETKAAQP